MFSRNGPTTRKEGKRCAIARYGEMDEIVQHFISKRPLSLYGRLREAWRCLFWRRQSNLDFDGLLDHLWNLLEGEVVGSIDRINEIDDLHRWLGENLTPTTGHRRVVDILDQIDDGWTNGGGEYPWDRDWDEYEEAILRTERDFS